MNTVLLDGLIKNLEARAYVVNKMGSFFYMPGPADTPTGNIQHWFPIVKQTPYDVLVEQPVLVLDRTLVDYEHAICVNEVIGARIHTLHRSAISDLGFKPLIFRTREAKDYPSQFGKPHFQMVVPTEADGVLLEAYRDTFRL